MTERNRADGARPGADDPGDDRIREGYYELVVESTTVGLLVDPLNQDAWIASSRPRRVEP